VDQKKLDTCLLVVGLIGLALAALSGLAEHVGFLHDFCAWFSGGCQVTAAFTLFRVKVWIWGAVFYGLILYAIIFSRGMLGWLIPAAVGVEAVLVAVMAYLGAVCVFCVANAVVVAVLAVLHVRRHNLWQSLALALAGLLVFGAGLAHENRLLELYCTRNPPPATTQNPKVFIPEGASQTKGPKKARVTIVEFSDFRCPACRRMHASVAEVMEAYGDKIHWVFKNFPLPSHKDAEIASEAALCAGAQGKFWEYHEVLFNFPDEFTPESLLKIAADLKLDTDAFKQCLDSHVSKQEIDDEVRQGLDGGINAVPTLLINGTRIVGTRTPDELKALIDAELAK